MVVAGGLAVASATLAGASSRSFRREGTTVLPFHPEQTAALVTTGANAVTRNPMYVGMALDGPSLRAVGAGRSR